MLALILHQERGVFRTVYCSSMTDARSKLLVSGLMPTDNPHVWEHPYDSENTATLGIVGHEFVWDNSECSRRDSIPG